MRIGIIGKGTLGGVLVNGFERHPLVRRVDATTRSSADRNRELAEGSDVVLVCVKPGDAQRVCAQIAPVLRSEQLLISAVATVGTVSLRAWTREHPKIVRVMPNTPARVACGMTVVATCDDAAAVERTCDLFDSFGRTLVLDESLMDAVTAVSGCGPAFAFVMMEAMIDGAIALGIPFDRARELVAQTMLGSAALLLGSAAHPGALKHEVTTPAGKTIRGLAELEAGSARSAIMRAVIAAGTSC
jgi:pyrroline-5-carboxylate reductase